VSRSRFIALLLVLGTLAVYLPATRHGFTLFDDNDYVYENNVVQNGLTWSGFIWAFKTWHASNWHPLTWLSHMLDCQIFGLNVGMHHAVNVLFHAANTVLLFALLLRLTGFRAGAPDGKDGAFWSSAFVAALFAWHPTHVESVAWIAERKDVLSTLFALLALLSYVSYAKENSRRSYWLTMLFLALGLLAKPMVVTLPFVMLLLDYWPLNRIENLEFRIRNFQKPIVEKIPFFALVAVSCVATFKAQHQMGAMVSLKNLSVHFRIENAVVAITRYVLKLLWPENLCIFYPLARISAMVTAGSVVILVCISIAVWLARKRSPYWLVGWLWFTGMLMPVVGLVQVGNAAMADRYTYFPSIGIFLAVTLGVCDAVERFHIPKTVVTAAAGFVLAACLFLTSRQLSYWRDDVALFSHAIAVTKDNDTAHINLGVALEKSGRKTEAITEYRTVIKLLPGRVEAHNNLANLLDDSGHPLEAIAEYQEALRLNPKHVAAHNNYGTLLVELGRYDEAAKQYAAATEADPTDWHAPHLMGKCLLKQGRDAEAIPYFRKALQLAPNELHVLTFLAQVLASDENPKVRDGNAAFALASKANALSGGIQPVMLDTLAMAYAELGHFDDARQAEEDSLKLAKAYDLTNDVPTFQQRWELYKNRQAFRQNFTNTPYSDLPGLRKDK
jgi:tetratricopeptide (TPR) repeat protein